MPRMKFFCKAVVFFMLGCYGLAVGVPPLRITEIVDGSDAVVIAVVNKTVPIGGTYVTYRQMLLSAEAYSSRAATVEILKGFCPAAFDVQVVMPHSAIGYRPLTEGRVLLFLKKDGNHYVPTSPYFPTYQLRTAGKYTPPRELGQSIASSQNSAVS